MIAAGLFLALLSTKQTSKIDEAIERNKPGVPAKNNPPEIKQVKSKIKQSIKETEGLPEPTATKVLKSKIKKDITVNPNDSEGVKKVKKEIGKEIQVPINDESLSTTEVRKQLTDGIQEVTGNPVSAEKEKIKEVAEEDVKKEKELTPEEHEIEAKKKIIERMKLDREIAKLHKTAPKEKSSTKKALEEVTKVKPGPIKNDIVGDTVTSLFGKDSGIGKTVRGALRLPEILIRTPIGDIKNLGLTAQKLWEDIKVAYKKGLFSKEELQIIKKNFGLVVKAFVDDKIDIAKLTVDGLVSFVKGVIKSFKDI